MGLDPEPAVRALSAAPKYAGIHPDTIGDIVAGELPHATSAADLERRSRLRLHKVAADYLMSTRPSRLLRGLDEAVAAGPAELKQWCRTVLAGHFSTAERLPDLDEVYPAIIELAGDPASIADLACALNPFTLPWLREHSAASYTGYDLNANLVRPTQAFLASTQSDARVRHGDVLFDPGADRAELAMLLKTFHCLEDRRKGYGLRVVELAPASKVLVSFPIKAMSGRAAVFVPRMLDQ
ncbi:MAG: hypothetical protein ABI140_12625, partial [Jatrophihabitantaceae bacterium]